MLSKELQGHTTQQLGFEILRGFADKQAIDRGAKRNESTGRLDFDAILDEKHKENEGVSLLTPKERALEELLISFWQIMQVA